MAARFLSGRLFARLARPPVQLHRPLYVGLGLGVVGATSWWLAAAEAPGKPQASGPAEGKPAEKAPPAKAAAAAAPPADGKPTGEEEKDETPHTFMIPFQHDFTCNRAMMELINCLLQKETGECTAEIKRVHNCIGNPGVEIQGYMVHSPAEFGTDCADYFKRQEELDKMEAAAAEEAKNRELAELTDQVEKTLVTPSAAAAAAAADTAAAPAAAPAPATPAPAAAAQPSAPAPAPAAAAKAPAAETSSKPAAEGKGNKKP